MKRNNWMKWLVCFGIAIIPLSAKAQDAKKDNAKPAVVAKPDTSDPNALFPEKELYTREEVQALRSVLDKKSTELEQDLESQKKYVESLKTQVTEHLTKVEAARNEIAEFMNAREEREEGKLKKLARFYEAMDAEQAAPLLKEVNDDLAIKIFDRMDVKKAGAILALMPSPRAAKLTQSFPKLKIQEASSKDGPAGRKQ